MHYFKSLFAYFSLVNVVKLGIAAPLASHEAELTSADAVTSQNTPLYASVVPSEGSKSTDPIPSATSNISSPSRTTEQAQNDKTVTVTVTQTAEAQQTSSAEKSSKSQAEKTVTVTITQAAQAEQSAATQTSQSSQKEKTVTVTVTENGNRAHGNSTDPRTTSAANASATLSLSESSSKDKGKGKGKEDPTATAIPTSEEAKTTSPTSPATPTASDFVRTAKSEEKSLSAAPSPSAIPGITPLGEKNAG